MSADFGVARFRRLLPAACAALAVNALADLVDLTIAGRILGETALAAIDLAWPVLEFLFFLGTTIAGGTAIAYFAALGSFSKDRASRVFSTGLHLALLSGLVCALAMLAGRETFFSFFGIRADMAACARPYWNVLVPQAVLLPLNIFLSTLVCADGGTRVTTAAFAVEFAVNVVSSWVLCSRFGTAGCAAGTLLGTLSGIIVSAFHFASDKCSFRLRAAFDPRLALRLLTLDLPSSSSFLFTAAVFAALNKILVSRFGEEALAVMAVVSVVGNFRQFLDGIPNALQPVAAVYFEERNTAAVRRVLREAVRFAVASGLVLTLVFFAFPALPGRVLGVDDPELAALAAHAVRIVSVGFTALALGSLLEPYYLFIRRPAVALAATVLFEAVFPLAGCIAGLAAFGYDGFWWGLAVTPLIGTLGFLAALGRRLGPELDVFFLPREDDGLVRSWTVRVGDRAACEVASAIHAILEERKYPLRTVVRADMLVEDTLMTVKERNGDASVLAEVTLDLRQDVKIAFRDDGAAAGSFTDLGDGDWLRAQTLGSVVRTAASRNDAMTSGFNRSEFVF